MARLSAAACDAFEAKLIPVKGDSAYDPAQLKMGVKVEMEHPSVKALGIACARRISKHIAKNHLGEFGGFPYYTELADLEKRGRKWKSSH